MAEALKQPTPEEEPEDTQMSLEEIVENPMDLLGALDRRVAAGVPRGEGFFSHHLLGGKEKDMSAADLLVLHEKGLQGLQNLLMRVEKSGPVMSENGEQVTTGDVERAIAQSESVIAELRAETEGQ